LDALNLKLPDYYLNRELAQLAFNLRVLKQAMDSSVPLLERLKFLCISSTNLDEFFEIRVSGLKHRLAVNAAPAGPDNLSSADVLRTVTEEANGLVTEQYRLLNDELIPKLREAGIHFVRRDDWSLAQRIWLEQYFRTEIVNPRCA
jgi:polyphosphate kinase